MDASALVAVGLTLALVLANGFFVAAEYAFVRIRKTQLDELKTIVPIWKKEHAEDGAIWIEEHA